MNTQTITEFGIIDNIIRNFLYYLIQVVSRRAKPYFDYKEKCEGDACKDDDPNEKFEGFSVDLVKNIIKILREEENYNYTYKFIHDKDLDYPGLVKVLLDKVSDISILALGPCSPTFLIRCLN